MPDTAIEYPNFNIVWDELHLTKDRIPFQYEWTFNPRACGRIPSDFGLQIVCTAGGYFFGSTGNNSGGYIESAGADYTAVEQCCPLERGHNEIRLSAMCQSVQCYTNDTALAARWGDCYRDAVKNQKEKLQRMDNRTWNPKGEGSEARCEWIDYNELKKGLRTTSIFSGVSKLDIGIYSIVMGCMAVAALSW